MHWKELLPWFAQVWLTLPLIIIPCQIGQIKLKGRIKLNKHFNKDIALPTKKRYCITQKHSGFPKNAINFEIHRTVKNIPTQNLFVSLFIA